MQFRILGAVEACRDDGNVVVIRRAKVRALLAMLLLHPERAVDVDALIDAVWGGQPPARAAATLQSYVSDLRRVVGAEMVVTEAPGYRLRVGDGALDAQRFERLYHDGRAAAAAGDLVEADRLLAAALTMWHGRPLTEFAYAEFAREAIGRLDEVYRTCREESFDVGLRLGRHAALLPDIEAMARANPFRERLWSQFMLTLYRSGRQADALRVYGELRRALAEELGIDPSHELQDLETAILQQRPDLHLPGVSTGSPDRLPVEIRPNFPNVLGQVEPLLLVGRDAELNVLRKAWADIEAGGRRLVWVTGEAGVGKTRVAGEIARELFGHGATVLYGRCDEEIGVPYQAILETLQHYVAHGPADVLGRIGAGNAAELSRLVPELAPGPGSPADSPKAEPQVRRYRLFQAVDSLLSAASRQNPMVLVLDDLHLADQPTLLLIRHLLRSPEPAAILLIGTYRDTDIAHDDPVAGAIAELLRETTTQRLSLQGLSRDEVSLLVRDVVVDQASGASDDLTSFFWEKTEGNPFFIRELLRHLGESAVLKRDDSVGSLSPWYRSIGVPPTLKDVIIWRVGRLPAAAQLALGVGAVSGRDFDVDIVARITDLSEEELLVGLEAATHARLIGEVRGSPGRYSFAHALTREAIYENLSGLRRARLHLRVGRLLEQLPDRALESRLGEIAHHFFAAGGTDQLEAIEYARRAGERALRQVAYEDAVAYLQQAATAARDRATNDDVLCSILLSLGEALRSTGDLAGARLAYQEAAELARRVGDGFRRAAAAVGLCAIEFERGSSDHDVVALVEDALMTLGTSPTPMRARALAGHAMALAWSGASARMAAISTEAVAAGRASGDAGALAAALSADFLAHLAREPRHCADAAHELVEIARAAGDLSGQAEGHVRGLISQLQLCDRPRAGAELTALKKFAAECGQPLYRWYALSWEATWAVMDGRFADAEGLAAAALNLGFAVRGLDATTAFVAHISPIRWAQDRIAELIPGVDAFHDQYPAVPGWAPSRLWILAVAGYTDRATVELDRLAGPGLEQFDETLDALSSFAFLAHTSAILDVDRYAADLYQRLLPFGAHQVVIPMWLAGGVASGVVPFYLGAVAAVAGEWQAAFDHFETAIEAHRTLGSRPWEGWTYLRYGCAVLARGTNRERTLGLDLLRRAISVADEVGMVKLKNDAQQAAGAASGEA